MSRRASLVPLAALIALWIVQLIRITHGVDFNDEAGYYGALLGLIAGGRLFSNDLFIQQNVYVLLWPLAKPYVAAFGTAWLIVFVRVVFAGFILWMYRRVRRSLESAGVPAAAASLAALTCSFVVPWANVYSVSYNSIGLGLTAASFAEFYAWRRRGGNVRAVWWAALLVVLFIAHPPLAAGNAVVLVARLWFDRDYPALRRVIISVCALGIVAAAALYPLAPTRADLAAGIAFSRAMGVGTVFRTGFLYLLAVIAALIAVFAFTQRQATGFARLVGDRPSIAAAVAAALCLTAVVMEGVQLPWLAAFILVFGGLALTAWPQGEEIGRRLWITMLLLGTGGLMTAASSNGFRQLQGAAMLAAPMYFASAVSARAGALSHARTRAGWIYGAGIVAAGFACWLANPYHDRSLLQQTSTASDAPAFRGLYVTQEKADAIRDIRAVLSDIPAGSRVMILGGQPWMYLATATSPDTDMVFMHSLVGLPTGLDILAGRLSLRHPDVVVVTGSVPDAVRRAFDGLVRQGRFTCQDRAAGAALDSAKERLQMFYPISPVISVCRPVT